MCRTAPTHSTYERGLLDLLELVLHLPELVGLLVPVLVRVVLQGQALVGTLDVLQSASQGGKGRLTRKMRSVAEATTIKGHKVRCPSSKN